MFKVNSKGTGTNSVGVVLMSFILTLKKKLTTKKAPVNRFNPVGEHLFKANSENSKIMLSILP